MVSFLSARWRSRKFCGKGLIVKRLVFFLSSGLACSSPAMTVYSPLGGSTATGGTGGGNAQASMASDGTVTIPGAFVAVSAGYDTACGLRTDGSISCWEFAALDQPTSYPGKFVSFTAGGPVCGLKADGTLACWGNTIAGEDSPPPGTYTNVASYAWYGCAVRKTDGTIACWGQYLSPASVQGETFVSISLSVSSGTDFACGVRTDSTLACWAAMIPLGPATPPAGTFTQVSAGDGYGCAVRTDGTIVCWGGAVDAKLSSPPASSSVTAGQAETFSAVSTSNGWVCALRKPDGALVCWGVHAGEYAPLASIPSGGFKSISVSAHDTCGVKNDGSIACWANPARLSAVGY
jgi:hypothetical protein